jgi:Fe-S protein assembly co-chaperone HscB
VIKSLEENSFNNHFSLFGEPEAFSIDISKLVTKRKELLLTVHPDKFSSGSDGQKKLALQWTTKINEAYSVLKDPARRAIYLCKLKGKVLDIEKSRVFSIEVLEEQMELRENLADTVKIFTQDKYNSILLDSIESRASLMLSNSVHVMSELFCKNFIDDNEVANKIEAQVNVCLFAQKFMLECFDVRRRFV